MFSNQFSERARGENSRFKSLFDSVVVDAFQITFCVKIHANDIFLFFKNYF
jgi:hypothetical protein